MNNRINILTLFPNKNDATSLYRGIGPFSKLHKLANKIYTFEETTFTWATISKADIVYFQRPFGKTSYDAAVIVKDSGIPLWVDYDDILFVEDIPDYNPVKYYFSNPNDRETYIEILKMADVISVTTQELKDRFSEYNDNIIVIPNAFDDYRFNFEWRNLSKKALINWRGSSTHSMDIRAINDSLVKIKSEYPDWIMNFIGDDATHLVGLECNIMKNIDPIRYFTLIKDLAPRIQLIPLENNKFNKSKSNIGWIEGVYSGAVGISPDYLPEFDRPGILKYSDPENFYEVLKETMTDHTKTEKNYKLSFNYIRDNLLLSSVNKKRVDLISSLL